MRRAQSFAFIVQFCAGFVLAGAGLGAAAAEGGQSGHAAAIHGTPKYGADFSHFDYVNPDAPKGGHVRLSQTGTFDNLNPFI
ncbi:MAG: ABC transporter substrate-binding protein, partial [Alphaproteobacteria bacterium]